MTLAEAIKSIEFKYPPQATIPGDYAGIICGKANKSVNKILFAVDLSMAVVLEAIRGGFDLLITFHLPYITKSLFDIRGLDARVSHAVENGLAIYSLSSNVEFGRSGFSYFMMEEFGASFEAFSMTSCFEPMYKIVVFVPLDAFEKFRKAILDIGAGYIGNYSHASFSAKGEGTFKPLPGSEPYIGEVGKFERVEEMRFETIVPQHLLDEVLEAINLYHPYEEPAVDVYSLNVNSKTAGFGVIGMLPYPMKLTNLIAECRQKFFGASIRVIESEKNFVQRVLFWADNVEKIIDSILDSGTDVVIAGEIPHSCAVALADNQIAAIEVGIFAAKINLMNYILKILDDAMHASEKNVELKVSESQREYLRHMA